MIAYDGLSATLGMPPDQVEVVVLALMLRPHPDHTPSAMELEGVAGICAIAFGPGRTGWQSWVPRVEQAHRLLYPGAAPPITFDVSVDKP